MLKHFKIVGIVLGASGLALGGDLYRRQVKQFCHIPGYNYQSVKTTNPSTTVSLLPIAAPLVAGAPFPVNAAIPADRKVLRVKQFQMTEPVLRVNHCTLTRVSVSLVEDGTWIVNAVAEQNPHSVSTVDQPRFIEFKRNGFHVRVRGVGLSIAEDPPATTVLGKPEYCNLPMPCFWVERGQIAQKRWDGRCDDVQRFFELVDRVEVDLSYE